MIEDEKKDGMDKKGKFKIHKWPEITRERKQQGSEGGRHGLNQERVNDGRTVIMFSLGKFKRDQELLCRTRR